ncbi:MAG: mucoidy inhibitor MuiA family protein [Kiloniellaceae bacterium]
MLLLLPTAGRAAPEVRGQAEIAAVTVFPDRAEVVRTLEVTLPGGQATVVIEGLPASLTSESVRVRGAAAQALRIGSVETKRHFAEGAVREEERRLSADLEALRDQQRALDDRIAAARIQLDFITAIGRDGPDVANREIAEGKLDPEAWRQAFAVIGDGAAKAYERIRAAEIEKRGLERKIVQTRQRLNRIRTGRTANVAARVNVETAGPTAARLHLSYQIPGASWRPLYDARLDSETARTAVVQIGEVRQRTGEDWSNVRLTLSTARPAQDARLPRLASWFIDFADQRFRPEQAKAEPEPQGLRGSLSAALEAPSAADEISAKSKAKAAAPVTAQVMASEFAAEYRIPGAASVLSDNEPHKFVIAERGFQARLAVRAVPKIAPQAHLYGEITYEGAEPWLPGPVSVFRDGAFVGTNAIPILRPGETFKLSFGVDDKVRVAYRLETGERSREGLINKNRRLERRYLVEVANHHARPMEITVLDQLPVPQDERIEVELLRASTKPSERDFDGRKGVLAWTDTYEPNEERTIRFAYAVSYPEDQTIPGF